MRALSSLLLLRSGVRHDPLRCSSQPLLTMYRAALVWLALCSPLLWILPFSFWIVSAALPLIVLAVLVAFFSLPAAPARFANEFRNIVIAHRGGQPTGLNSSDPQGDLPPSFPENSIPAFRWACSDACGGADAIELDVWLSRDGVAMVNHDPKLFRHFESDAEIANLTCAQIKQIKFLREPVLPAQLDPRTQKYERAERATHRECIHPDYIRTERMPTLEEVLTLVRTEFPTKKIMIEVKERLRVQQMAQELSRLFQSQKEWMYTHAFVAAFNPWMLYSLRRIDSEIVTSFLFINDLTRNLLKNAADMRYPVPGWIAHNLPLRWIIDDCIWELGTNPRGLRFLGANLSACEVKALTENQIRRDRAAGIITSTWCANNAHQKEHLLQLGVTVITDLQFGGGCASQSPRPQIIA